VGIDKKRHGKEISRPAGAEASGNEFLVDQAGAFAPAGPAHAARIEEIPRAAAREAKAVKAAAMQQIGVLD
jgi:hypothetical protein